MYLQVMGLVTSMLQASVHDVDINVSFDVPVRFNLVPSTQPVIFAGQHFTAYARMPAGAEVFEYKVKEHPCKCKTMHFECF